MLHLADVPRAALTCDPEDKDIAVGHRISAVVPAVQDPGRKVLDGATTQDHDAQAP